jgi:hypothetical protein
MKRSLGHLSMAPIFMSTRARKWVELLRMTEALELKVR